MFGRGRRRVRLFNKPHACPPSLPSKPCTHLPSNVLLAPAAVQGAPVQLFLSRAFPLYDGVSRATRTVAALRRFVVVVMASSNSSSDKSISARALLFQRAHWLWQWLTRAGRACAEQVARGGTGENGGHVRLIHFVRNGANAKHPGADWFRVFPVRRELGLSRPGIIHAETIIIIRI
jgi:hypothetical protein